MSAAKDPFPFGLAPALDLGWCIVRQLDERQICKMRKIPKAHRDDARMALSAGFIRRQFNRLPAERRREIQIAIG